MRDIKLRAGLSLLNSEHGYILGNRSARIGVSTPFERSALLAVARNERVSSGEGVDEFLDRISAAGFITRSGEESSGLPHRRDIATRLISDRIDSELLQCDWAPSSDLVKRETGERIFRARSSKTIAISGRGRVATLLALHLRTSGVGSITFYDCCERTFIEPCDIGFASITEREIGNNFYQHLDMQMEQLSFIASEIDSDNELGACSGEIDLIIHCGEMDIERTVDWMNSGQAHIVIPPHNGDEVAISPVIKGGHTPCLRCMQLHERDRFGFMRSERLPLGGSEDLPIIGANFVAALVASAALSYIDGLKLKVSYNGYGRATYLRLNSLHELEVENFARHPLCGCSYFE